VKTEVDVSRIIPYLLKPNSLALLHFPDGVIPIRVLKNEFFNYLYDPIAEGQIANPIPPSTSTDGAKNIGFIAPELLKSRIIAAQPINVFRIDRLSLLYQVFVGIAPSYARIFYAIPSTSAQRNLNVINWGIAYAAAGFIDGFTSPLLYPSPDSEFVITYGLEPGIGYASILQESVYPLLWFYVNRVEFGVVLDVELIMEMLDQRGRGEKAFIKTIGGMTNFTYQYRDVFRIRPIPLTATREAVKQIVDEARR